MRLLLGDWKLFSYVQIAKLLNTRDEFLKHLKSKTMDFDIKTHMYMSPKSLSGHSSVCYKTTLDSGGVGRTEAA